MPVFILLHFVNHKASVLGSYWPLVVSPVNHSDAVEAVDKFSDNTVPGTNRLL